MIVVFSCLTIFMGVIAAFAEELRRSALALWVCGLSIGAIYLSLGAEILAVAQWILSTFSVIALLFHSVLFGEYGSTSPTANWSVRITRSVAPVLAGGAFAWMVVLGFGEVMDRVTPEEGGAGAHGLAEMGRALAERHMLSVEILGLTLFLVVVGVGVVARVEADSGNTREAK